ncbi:MAG: hypothetical protein C4303_06800 [candidate division GAL15 bacterium]
MARAHIPRGVRIVRGPDGPGAPPVQPPAADGGDGVAHHGPAEGSRVKVLVYGAGAVGSLLGAALARAGARVTLLGRAPHGQAAAREGLRVDGPAGTGLRVSLRAVSRVQELDAPFDVLLVTVKGYDTHRAAPELPSLLAPDGRAVCFQNGVGHEEILARYVGGTMWWLQP